MSDLLQRLDEIGYNTGEVDAGVISRLIPECAEEIRRLLNKDGVTTDSRQIAALKAALPLLTDYRDVLFENASLKDGTIPDERYRREITRFNKVIAECQAVIAESAAENRQKDVPTS